MSSQTIACIIPARLNATRFPKKLLSMLDDKPLLQWVWEAACSIQQFDQVLFAVDHQELCNVIDSFHGKWVMTSTNCPTGTHRVIEVMQQKAISADIWINWQADEPFINSVMISELLQSCTTNDADIWTLKKRILHHEDLHNPAIAKVVSDAYNNALYFSRSMIPFIRDVPSQDDLQIKHYKHVGIYAYTTKALQMINKLPSCSLEDAEKLEQLRYLYHGLTIKLHTTNHEVIGIDTPKDLEKAHHILKQKTIRQKNQIAN